MPLHVYMFPGQGSQKTKMGSELFSEFQQDTQKASEIVGFDLQDMCCNIEKQDDLNNTLYTQPALYWVNALYFINKQQQKEISNPAIFAGHSLGEYNALHAAGVLKLLDGLKAVTARAKLMAEAGLNHPGAMAAVLGLSANDVTKVCNKINSGNKDGEEATQTNNVFVANFNTSGQVVVSGSQQKISNAEEIFKEAGAKRYIPLKVSGAFHSPLMQDAAKQFASVLNKITFLAPQQTVYSNVSAQPHLSDPSTIKEAMLNQLCSSVRWHETLLNIKKNYQIQNEDFTELGPGSVLTGLLRKA